MKNQKQSKAQRIVDPETIAAIKPSTKKYRVALFNTPSWGAIAVADNGENQGLSYEALPGFVRWLTDWVEYVE